ncbi:MAG: spore germination protein GerPE [Bacillus sp. (in: firmicutes)]
MLSRTSRVKQLKVVNLSLGSNLQIGDAKYLDSFARALAVQEADEVWDDDPEDFSDYPVFTKPLACPVIYENVNMTKIDKKPSIHVDWVDVTSIAAASTMAIGHIEHVRTVARIINIRRLQHREVNGPLPNNPKGE